MMDFSADFILVIGGTVTVVVLVRRDLRRRRLKADEKDLFDTLHEFGFLDESK